MTFELYYGSRKRLSALNYPRPLRGTLCHLFFERPFVALVYHPPVVQIVVHYPQQVVWNFLPHHRLDAVLSSRGIERIAYVNANQRTESLTFTSSPSRFSGDVCHCLDGVHCFKGETPWVLFELTNQVFPAMNSAFLYTLPQGCFRYSPCLMQ